MSLTNRCTRNRCSKWAAQRLPNNVFNNIAQVIQQNGNGLIFAWGDASQPAVNLSGNMFSHMTGSAVVPAVGLRSVKGVVSGNTFSDIGGTGISLYDKVGNLTISSNLFDSFVSASEPPVPHAGAGLRIFSSAAFVGPCQ